MKIKTVIIIIASLFLVLAIFLGYVFLVSNTGVEAPEIIKKEPKQNDFQMVEEGEANKIEGGEGKKIEPEESRKAIINNLTKEGGKEEETEAVEPKRGEEELVKKQEEVDKKVQDIRKILLK